MPWQKKLVLSLVTLMLSGVADAGTTAWQVRATGTKLCTAYWHHRDDGVPKPLIISFKGTGVYTTASARKIDAAVRPLFRAGLVSVLTFDKPGIRPLVPHHGTATVMQDVYSQYIQEDLVQCAVNALQTGPVANGSPVLLSGHSEGAQVAVRLLERTGAPGSALLSRIRAAFLSSTPFGKWRDILAGQLGNRRRQEFFRAFARGDDQALFKFGSFTTAYLRHIFDSEPLQETIVNLQQEGVATKLYFYHGLRDQHTPVEGLKEFASNHHLFPDPKLVFRYYPSGHSLNQRAVRDISQDMRLTVNELQTRHAL